MVKVREREGGELVQNLTSDSPWFFIQVIYPLLDLLGPNLMNWRGRSAELPTSGSNHEPPI